VWLAVAMLACVGTRSDAPASGSAPAASSPAPVGGKWVVVQPDQLSVTSGAVVAVNSGVVVPISSGAVATEEPGRFSIRSPTFRAELGRTPRAAVEMSFVYHGPASELAPLASGEPRRQIGLKLRARDSCNVVYAMWHIAPSSGIVVSVKSNPGQSRHAECGEKGYRFLSPTSAQTAPRIEPGQPHVLSAEIRGRTLRVETDGQTSWEGELPATAFEFDGPVGLRSDNGEFSVVLRAQELLQ
jgi:hypothetical protein